MNSVRNTLELRKYNKKQVIEALRDRGDLTMNELARGLQLSVSTIGNIGRELLDEGIIREGQSRQPSGGRSPRVMALVPASRTIICLDLTRREEMVLQLCDLKNNELARTTIDCKECDDVTDLVERACHGVHRLLKKEGFDASACLGLGVIAPGWYDCASGRVLNSTNPVIEGAVLKKDLEAVLRMPVLIGNDANLGALALSKTDGSSPQGYIALLYVGTGLGVGVVGDGRIICGSRGFAAEIAHLPLGDPQVECYCGHRGCLEGLLSLQGLLRLYQGPAIPAEEIAIQAFEGLLSSYRAGEPRASAAVDHFMDSLGLAVSIVTNLFDCETVYLGGIVDSFFDDIVSPVRDRALERVHFAAKRSLQIKGLGSTQRVLFAGCAEMVFSHWVP